MEEGHKFSDKAKINFLNQEISQQKDHIEQLEHMLNLNKQALKIFMNPENQKSLQGDIRQFQVLNKELLEENDYLKQKNIQIQKERNAAQGQILILEQMYDSSERQKKELTRELELKINGQQKRIKEQEKIINDLEKIKPEYDQITNIVVKYRDIVSYNDQTKIMHDEIENLNLAILKLTKDVQTKNDQKEELVQINIKLDQQVNKLKNYIRQRGKSNVEDQEIALSCMQSYSDNRNRRMEQINELVDQSPQGVQSKSSKFNIPTLNVNVASENTPKADYVQENSEIPPLDKLYRTEIQSEKDEDEQNQQKMNMIQFHKQFLKEDSNSQASNESEDFEPLPIKVPQNPNKIQTKIDLTKLTTPEQDPEKQLKNFNFNSPNSFLNQKQNDPSIQKFPQNKQTHIKSLSIGTSPVNNAILPSLPKLDLTKAKQIMENTVAKQLQADNQLLNQKQYDLQPFIDKIKKLEEQLDSTRKKLAKEMILTKQLQLQNQELQRINTELEARNETLIYSNDLYNKKWTKIHILFQFFQQFFRNHTGQQVPQKSELNEFKANTLTIKRNGSSSNQINSQDDQNGILTQNLSQDEQNMNEQLDMKIQNIIQSSD